MTPEVRAAVQLADPIIHIEDPKACGLFTGETCCAFLMAGEGGRFICGRSMPGIEWTIRDRLAEGTMNAKYAPEVGTAFPDCQAGAGKENLNEDSGVGG